jgi:hypothetical protein
MIYITNKMQGFFGGNRKKNKYNLKIKIIFFKEYSGQIGHK